MDKNKCPILIFQKTFIKNFVCFFDETENENIIIISGMNTYMIIK